jgi:limonene-1,2-epoxide hydrolase
MIAGFFALYRIEIVTDRMISKDGWIWTQRRDYMVTRDGKEGMVPVVGIMHVVDGKIASWEEYFDEKTFERASGIQL